MQMAPLRQSSVFVSGSRPRTDFSWAIFFCLSVVLIMSTGVIFIPSANFSGLERYSKAATSTECFSYLNVDDPFVKGSTIQFSDVFEPESFNFDNTNGKDDGENSEGFLRVSE